MVILDSGYVLILMVYFLSYIRRVDASAIPNFLNQLSTLPNSTLSPNHALNLIAPTPRLGFHISFVTNDSQMLGPLEVYQNAIQMLYVLALQPKNALIEGSMGMSDNSFKTACGIFRRTDTPLETDVAITALYQTAIHIALKNAYYGLEAPFSLNSLHVGTVRFFTIELTSTKPTFDGNAELAASGLNPLYAASRPDQGYIHDDRDPKFFISYAYDGVKLQSKDVFTAFLNALAISSEHENSDLQAEVAAAPSAGGDVILSTWTLGEDKKSKMTWRLLKRALLVLWGRLIIGEESERPRFEGLKFGFVYNGVQIGGGALIKVVGGVEDTLDRGTALSR